MNTFVNPYTERGNLLKQANIINSSRYDLSATELNILFVLLYEMKRANFDGNTFSIDLGAMCKATGARKADILKAANALIVRRFIKKANVAGNKITSFTTFASSIEYNETQNILTVQVSSLMMLEYRDLKSFTEFEIRAGIGLNSKYAKRIYQMLIQFKDAPPPPGYPNPVFYINVDELRQRLGLVNVETGAEKLKQWGQFKSFVLDIATREINENDYDIKIAWNVHKKVKAKISILKFDIFVQKALNSSKQENIYNQLVTTYKLSPWQAKKLVLSVKSEDINKVLELINKRLTDPTTKIKDIGAFSAKLFHVSFPQLNLYTDKNENNNNTQID